MLVREVSAYLPKKIRRSLAADVVLLPGTDRLPRYRISIPPDVKDLLVGMTLADRYYVLSVLGFGGMSVVYKARTLKRAKPIIVAVKTLRTQGLRDELVVKRFQREAELLSHLNHPRIVQVHDHGYTKRGQPYFVMDYLIGENLAEVLKREGSISPLRARHIFNQVCGAVDHAHRCGVVHRDLKPGNIMLMDLEGEQDFVKVVDFGIARFEEEAQRLTRLGEVWGSPIYMSPEQCMGAPLDARSDIYSLGIVMYEALTGEVPFFGKNYVETMSKQISELPRSFNEVQPELVINRLLEQVVMRALSKAPEQRYQSMAELRADLENAFSGDRARTTRSGLARASQPRLKAQRVESEPGAANRTFTRPGRPKPMMRQLITLFVYAFMFLAFCFFVYKWIQLTLSSMPPAMQSPMEDKEEGQTTPSKTNQGMVMPTNVPHTPMSSEETPKASTDK